MEDKIEKLRKEASGKETSFRSCWECNPAHEHLKKADFPIYCFLCGKYFYKGQDITVYPEEIKPKESESEDDWMTRAQVTIMKYSFIKDGKRIYAFEVMDKYDIEDEADRLDAMLLKSKLFASTLEGYKQHWVKNTMIV